MYIVFVVAKYIQNLKIAQVSYFGKFHWLYILKNTSDQSVVALYILKNTSDQSVVALYILKNISDLSVVRWYILKNIID